MIREHYLVIDTETTTRDFTALNGQPDGHIVEIAICLVTLYETPSGRRGWETRELANVQIQDPDCRGDEWVYRHTDLIPGEGMTRTAADNYLSMIVKMQPTCTATAYNVGFDRTMIERDLPELAKCLDWGEDIMLRAAAKIPDVRKSLHWINGEIVAVPRCADTMTALGINEFHIHRASADAQDEAAIIGIMWQRHLLDVKA